MKSNQDVSVFVPERLREELEAEKFQAVEEARVIVSKHLEYVNANLREQLAEAVTNSNQVSPPYTSLTVPTLWCY